MKTHEKFDDLTKILLIGESGVGKTCILQKFHKGDFIVNHLTTIAIDFKMKIMDIDGIRLKMQVWDTAGQERFDTLTTSFFKSAQGIMICYSITDDHSFKAVNKWIKQIKDLAPKDVKVVMLGNKLDLESERTVPKENAEALANEYDLDYFEVSAFSGENINESFLTLGRKILQSRNSVQELPTTPVDFIEGKQPSGCCGK